MLNQTVDIVYETVDIHGLFRVRGLVETLSELKIGFTERDGEYNEVSAYFIKSINVVDEDDHHQFVNDMLQAKLKLDVQHLYAHCVREMDKINAKQLTPIEYSDLFNDLLFLSSQDEIVLS